MRHNYKGRKLGTDFSHTKAMKKSLVNALFLNDRIKTVESRAKEIRPNVDKIITWAKRGDLHSRRLAIAALGDKDLVREIFEKVEQGMFADRQGGYTRIMKLGNRKGDNAPMVIMELVTEPCVPKAERKAAAEKKAAAKKAAPKKVAKKADKSEELAEDLGFEADGTVEQIEAVDAAEAVAENGAEMTDAEKVEAVEEKKAEESVAAAITGNTVTAPLPGRIIEFKVKVGDTVKAGQEIVVLEAMKMENSVTTDYAGTVKQILAHPGDNVATDAVLVEIV